jgi:hypothetical protein
MVFLVLERVNEGLAGVMRLLYPGQCGVRRCSPSMWLTKRRLRMFLPRSFSANRPVFLIRTGTTVCHFFDIGRRAESHYLHLQPSHVDLSMKHLFKAYDQPLSSYSAARHIFSASSGEKPRSWNHVHSCQLSCAYLASVV